MKERKPGLYALGTNICALRKAKRMTQEQLAEIVGLDPRRISCYENGREEMGVLTYDKIIEALGPKKDAQTDKLLLLWDALTPENKAFLLEMANKLGQTQSPK